MQVNHFLKAQEGIQRWREFEECLLHDVKWVKFGTEIDVVLNIVRDATGLMRSDALERPQLVYVRLIGVQKFELENHMTDGMLKEPDRLDWGISEIARVQLHEHLIGDRPYAEVIVRWEGQRRLSAVAADVQIISED